MTDHVPEVLLPLVMDMGQDLESPFKITEVREEQISTPDARQIILKRGDGFLVMDVCGDFLSTRQEMGLFWHGTRFLRTCNLLLQGRPLIMLSHHVADVGDACQIDLMNPPLRLSAAMLNLPAIQIEQGAIHVHRQLELHHDQLVQTITITSFHADTLPLNLSLKIGADFCDLFEVRGFARDLHGTLRTPEISDNTLTISYQGLDQVERSSHLLFEPQPYQILYDSVRWLLVLKRGESVELRMVMKMSQSDEEGFASHAPLSPEQRLPLPGFASSNPLFDRLLATSVNDLTMLCTITPHGAYPYAGTPWFSCPFGRDGLLTSLQFLPWFPEVARGTLAFLAAYQGTKVDPFTDEEPGKLFHEFRTGEMANRREIPYIPYYGSVDVTPLFLITLEAYIRWTNDTAFLTRLWPNAEAAARWLLDYGDCDGDSFIEYHKASEKGLSNQGWKDAWDAVSRGDGLLAFSPIALCEVQGYAYAAYRAMSYLAGRLGRTQDAQQWHTRAEVLQKNFLRHFWWEQEQLFYLALDRDKQPCDVVSSNAGQCLWTGIVPQELSQPLIERLMREDMYSGWGLRTLSTRALRYNPMSYHNGSVWPHDTAQVGAGFARYGAKAQATTLLKSLFDASLHFEGARLPELYCGFVRRGKYGPTRYPVACSPQAWAAGAPFALLSALLGLQPDAERQRLTLDHPQLPGWLQHMEISGLRLGQKQLRLRFITAGGNTDVIVEEGDGVDVRIV